MTVTNVAASNGRTMAQDLQQPSYRQVPIALTRVTRAGEGQRAFRSRIHDKIVKKLDVDKLGTPVVSYRDGVYWILDGQHRIAALKTLGWEYVTCQVHEGLTEAREAELFDGLNDSVSVLPIEKFGARLKAGYAEEREIDRVLRIEGLSVTRNLGEGTVRSVATLRRIHSKGGSETLAKTLRIARDSFGSAGLSGPILEGIGLVCIRYGDKVNEITAVEKLSRIMGRANGLLGRAAQIQGDTGREKAHCVAAAIVEFLNRGVRGRNLLSNWWREEAES